MVRNIVVDVGALFVIVALVAGCAGSRSSASDLTAAAVAPAGDLSGRWYGSFGQVAASLYEDESKSVLQINPDGTFMATVARALGTNNLAKPSKWSGMVVTNGDRVTLQNSQGRWPWIILTRSGDHTLYGVATDPAIEAPVMIRFEREGAGRP
jgi:hypothetical protein